MIFYVIENFLEGEVKHRNKAKSKKWKAGSETGHTRPVPSMSPRAQMRFKGSYYRWMAQKKQTTAGGDPITGRTKSVHRATGADMDAYRASHKAMARTYLKHAAADRKRHGSKKLPG